jgi:hypothetical protein
MGDFALLALELTNSSGELGTLLVKQISEYSLL